MTQQRPQVVTIDPNYSINRLVVAMFQEAVKQARRCDRSARQWLYAEGVLWIDVILDVHPDHTRRWLDRQLKRRKKKKPNLDTVSIHAENMRASLPIF